MFSNQKLIKYFFISIFLVEYFSLIGHIYPLVNNVVFFLIILAFIFVSIYKIEYGLMILLAELFIGSFGRLFAFPLFGFPLSIRIALWFVFLLIWFAKEIADLRRRRFVDWKSIFGIKDSENQIVFAFFGLFFFVIWGFANGLLNQSGFGAVFSDFNAWLYLALLFPILRILRFKQNKEILIQILLLSTAWLSFKTFFLLFIFSHNMLSIVPEFYAWVRDTRIGEITQMQGGFYRIFMQSHIFVMIAFSIVLALFAKSLKSLRSINKENLLYYFLATVFSAVNLISLSRSNWLGLALGLVLFGLFLLYSYGFKKFLLMTALIVFSGCLSVGLIALTVKFPFPDPTGGFSTSELLSERAKQLSGEAGVSSRWSLLPELWKEIKTAPILGKGFGAPVTYRSSDPRVLEANPNGLYTTSAFEWGWLDIWLKLGIFGALSYLLIIILLFKVFVKNIILRKPDYSDSDLTTALMPTIIIGLAVIALINFFSPYLNHPLGIGYLLIVAAILQADEH